MPVTEPPLPLKTRATPPLSPRMTRGVRDDDAQDGRRRRSITHSRIETARGEPRGSLAVREVRIVDEAGAVRAVLGVDDAGRVALDLMDPDGTGRTSLWLAGEDQGRQCGLTLTGSGGRWPGVIQVRGGDWSLYAQARPGGPTIPVFLRPGGRIAGAKNGPGL